MASACEPARSLFVAADLACSVTGFGCGALVGLDSALQAAQAVRSERPWSSVRMHPYKLVGKFFSWR